MEVNLSKEHLCNLKILLIRVVYKNKGRKKRSYGVSDICSLFKLRSSLKVFVHNETVIFIRN